jgi:hypothetical protein
LQPIPAYSDVFPEGSDLCNLAYHFTAEYESGSLGNPAVIEELEDAVVRWRHMWESPPFPKLQVCQLDSENYILVDTRGLPGNPEMEFLTANQASIVLAGTGPEEGSTIDIQWALNRGYCVEMENRVVPLAIAPPELLDEIERKHSRGHSS